MDVRIRRLGPGDETLLAQRAIENADFDLDGRSGPVKPLADDAASAYLANPNVLHWVAEKSGRVVGDLHCYALQKRAGEPMEVLLYEIGVRQNCRREGIGASLVRSLLEWMSRHGVKEAWVLADNPGAVEFYKACGFKVGSPAPTYLIT